MLRSGVRPPYAPPIKTAEYRRFLFLSAHMNAGRDAINKRGCQSTLFLFTYAEKKGFDILLQDIEMDEMDLVTIERCSRIDIWKILWYRACSSWALRLHILQLPADQIVTMILMMLYLLAVNNHALKLPFSHTCSQTQKCHCSVFHKEQWHSGIRYL